MKRFLIPVLLGLTIFITACSSASASDQAPPLTAPASNDNSTSTDGTGSLPALLPNTAGGGDIKRTDQQGMVVIEVTPLNLDTPTDTFDFEVALETHSVDLSMDLATLATLTTDAGVTVQATLWDAPRGGHHVSGKLIFPSTQDAKPILEGATKLTLTILNVDAPSRVFEWVLK